MGRFDNKRQDVIGAAIRIFSKDGFLAASVNNIARDAGVSKRTLYKYFRSKIELFSAIIEYMARELQDVSPPSSEADGDPRATLIRYARNYIALVLSPTALNLSRIVVADARRFPTLGRTFHTAGLEKSNRAFAAYLTKLRERGILKFEDADLLAEQFEALCLGQLRARAYYDPSILRQKAAIERRITSAVDLFLRGCGYEPNESAQPRRVPVAPRSRAAEICEDRPGVDPSKIRPSDATNVAAARIATEERRFRRAAAKAQRRR